MAKLTPRRSWSADHDLRRPVRAPTSTLVRQAEGEVADLGLRQLFLTGGRIQVSIWKRNPWGSGLDRGPGNGSRRSRRTVRD
ncbi:hypothetical protein [Phytohabitans flavus]|uniref:hypothetical protein n=1 Tax=Phytohabitans flavus TaxID=1076124 RepID=UPI00156645B0|nr:hypothetical protein [Phytohabitans flavus]